MTVRRKKANLVEKLEENTRVNVSQVVHAVKAILGA